jgi:hypothetical protein
MTSSFSPYQSQADAQTTSTAFGPCPNAALLTMSSLSSLRFDPGAYNADLKQSVGPGQYVLSPHGPNCKPCMQGDPRVSAGFGAGTSDCETMPLVDVESDLHNIGRRATHAPGGLYRGDGSAPSICGGGALRPIPLCEALPSVDTRMAHPPCTLRGTGWNRWEWLCQDPQQRATTLLPFDANVDTSLVVKDNHRPNLARPVDQTLAMPPGKRDRSADVGAPQWIPKTCNGVGAVDEPPTMLWRNCEEVARL